MNVLYSQEYHILIHDFALNALKKEITNAQHLKNSVGVLLVDVDLFGSVNYKFGHSMADLILSCLDSLFRSRINSMECWASNFRSDEFLIVLPGVSLEDLRQTAEEICVVTQQMTLLYDRREIGPVTVSIGGSFYPEHGTTSECVLFAAEEALFHAKAEGRNRVVMQSDINRNK